LAQGGFIDRRALLETLNFPGWKEIVERMGENQLDQALNILVESGLPIEMAQQLQIQLSQSQGGPGDMGPVASSQPKPGVPKAQQGRTQ
jgi:hypothetical protein